MDVKLYYETVKFFGFGIALTGVLIAILWLILKSYISRDTAIIKHLSIQSENVGKLAIEIKNLTHILSSDFSIRDNQLKILQSTCEKGFEKIESFLYSIKGEK